MASSRWPPSLRRACTCWPERRCCPTSRGHRRRWPAQSCTSAIAKLLEPSSSVRPERWYRRLLRLFPSDFRGDFGDEMTDVFRDQHRDASRGGTMALITLWWDTVKGILTTAPAEHFDLLRSDLRYAIRNLRRS